MTSSVTAGFAPLAAPTASRRPAIPPLSSASAAPCGVVRSEHPQVAKRRARGARARARQAHDRRLGDLNLNLNLTCA